MTTDDVDQRHWLKPSDEAFGKNRLLRLGATVDQSDRGSVQIRANNWPLAHYLSLRHITGKQYAAGSKLFFLWKHRNALSAHVQFGYEEMTGGTAKSHDLKLRVPREYLNAVQAIQGVKQREMAVRVCVDGRRAGKDGGMDLLRDALDDLAEYFQKK